jgi:signal transduction histidine kinase
VPQPMTGPIEALVAGFGKLGRSIAVTLPGDLAGPAAEAAHGIVREALTNALRYAPGAATSVRIERVGATLELAVDNDASRAGAAERDLGSGRGIAGMRERAAAIGGELSAGPRPEGGWRVHAVLPEPEGGRQWSADRRRNYAREQRIADAAVVGAVTAGSFSVGLTGYDHDGDGLLGTLPLALLLTIHALPLLWRRRAPWLVLAAVALTTLPWPVLAAWGLLPPYVVSVLAPGVLAELAAVYAVAAYGRPVRKPPPTTPRDWAPGSRGTPVRRSRSLRLTWLSVPLAACGIGVSLTVTGAVDGRLMGRSVDAVDAVFVFGEWVLPITGGLLAMSWLAGWAMHRRRVRVVRREDTALAVSLWRAEDAADGERQRIAAGLHEEVLRQTAQVVSSAEAENLDEVATATKSALAAMRGLLGSLGAGEPSRLSPQPTSASIDSLCRTLRAGGREVTLHASADVSLGLPPQVGLSAFRAVETMLGAGDTGAAHVVLWRGPGEFTITVSGVPLAGTGQAAERLRVQTGAVDGQMTVLAFGMIRVRLPLAPA